MGTHDWWIQLITSRRNLWGWNWIRCGVGIEVDRGGDGNADRRIEYHLLIPSPDRDKPRNCRLGLRESGLPP